MKNFEAIKFKIIVILFLVLLIIPNAIQMLGLEKNVVHNENRKYESLPKFDISNPLYSVSLFKSYYLENYGSKTTLVNNYIEFKSEVLNENPVPNRVLKGKDGWLFIGNHYNNVLNNSFGNDNFTKKELAITVNFFKEIRTYLDSKNIAFYLAIPPDKNRLYQEYLPYSLQQNKTKLETLEAELKAKANIEVINLYKPLLSNKEKHSQYLYLKTDTHWNYYGAYIGYSAIIDQINKLKNISKVPIDDFIITETKIDPLDLSKMINLKGKEKAYSIKRKKKSEFEIVKSTKKKLHLKNESKLYKAILYRDSFTNAMAPFFNETFSEIIYNRNYIIDKNEIETFKPDIVIFEVIERNINIIARTNPFKK